MQVTRKELDKVRNCKTLVHKMLGRVRSVRKVCHLPRHAHCHVHTQAAWQGHTILARWCTPA